MRIIELNKKTLAIAILAAMLFVILAAACLNIMNGSDQGNSALSVAPASYDSGLSGKGAAQSASSYSELYPTPAPTGVPSQADNAYTSLSDRKVIMTASVQIETDSLDRAVNGIRSIASGAGGYVESSNTWLVDNNKRQTSITIKLPQSAFESGLSQIKMFGNVKSESTSGQDVTRQYVDLNASLKNLQAEEKQLAGIMNMSKNVTEVLSVEKELYRVRGDIQTTQAELNYLGSQVDFSTITVQVSEPQPVVGYDWGLDTALKDAAHGFIGMIGGLVVLTGYLIPLALYVVIALAVAYVAVRLASRLYARWKYKEGGRP